jgi:flagellar basal-body rod modification protein FlgD
MTASSVAGLNNSGLLTNYINSQSSAATSSTGFTSGSSATTNLSSSLNIDFATYIQILTTQLQNQDPTDATDPNEFTQELVEMGGVEQQINTNQDLTQLLNQGTSNSLATGAGYIGNYVGAASSSQEFALQSGSSEFGYTLASAASSATITIKDSNGDTVATFAAPTTTGANYVSWNGQNDEGTQEPDGTYTYSVDATDANGNAVSVTSPTVLAKVTGVQTNSDGTLELLAGSLSVASSNVQALYTANSMPNSTALNNPSS